MFHNNEKKARSEREENVGGENFQRELVFLRRFKDAVSDVPISFFFFAKPEVKKSEIISNWCDVTAFCFCSVQFCRCCQGEEIKLFAVSIFL